MDIIRGFGPRVLGSSPGERTNRQASETYVSEAFAVSGEGRLEKLSIIFLCAKRLVPSTLLSPYQCHHP